MNVYDYIDEYGIYSFLEKPFNEVDSAIFSFLSYADFRNIFDLKKKKIQDIGRKHFGMHDKKEKNVIAVKEGNHLLEYLKDTKRYKDCIVYNYEYLGSKDLQFGVIGIEFQKNYVYVSFEGTDELFSGWKENFLLSCEFPTKSHRKAIDYLNKHYTFSRKHLIIGGHSKGGNLAMVAAAFSNYFVRRKIVAVYNFDGPGLLEEQFQSYQFQRIKDKYIHIIPDYSVVGLLLLNFNDYIVKSNNKTILSHNIVYWEIDNDHFKKGKLSVFSRELNKEIDAWISKYSVQDKLRFIANLDSICQKAGVDSFIDLMEEKKKILDLIYSSKDLETDTKKILAEFLNLLLKCYNHSTKEEIKNMLQEKINISFEHKKSS